MANYLYYMMTEMMLCKIQIYYRMEALDFPNSKFLTSQNFTYGKLLELTVLTSR